MHWLIVFLCSENNLRARFCDIRERSEASSSILDRLSGVACQDVEVKPGTYSRCWAHLFPIDLHDYSRLRLTSVHCLLQYNSAFLLRKQHTYTFHTKLGAYICIVLACRSLHTEREYCQHSHHILPKDVKPIWSSFTSIRILELLCPRDITLTCTIYFY